MSDLKKNPLNIIFYLFPGWESRLFYILSYNSSQWQHITSLV